MRKAIYIFQELLKIMLIFLLCFVWLRYFFSLALAVILSAVATLAIYLVLFFAAKKRKNYTGMKMKEKEDAELMFLSLCCSDNPVDFFYKLALKKHSNVSKKKTYIVVNHEDTGTKTILFPHLQLLPLSPTEFLNIYHIIKKEKAGKIVICTYEADKSLSSFLSNFKEEFLILDRYQTYQKLYKFYDFFPEITCQKPTAQKSYKELLAYSFNKKRAKGYIISALALIFCSLFVRTTLYYCIVASILLLFAIFSYFNPQFNQKSAQTDALM